MKYILNRIIVIYVGRKHTDGTYLGVNGKRLYLMLGKMEVMNIWRRMFICVGGHETSTFCA